MYGEDVLCHVDPAGYDSRSASPFEKSGELMKSLSFPLWHVFAEIRVLQSSHLA
jgi:hypothetical protein